MPEYGEIRVDYITYTTGTSPNEGQGTVTVSGLINNPTFSGNVIIANDLTVSGKGIFASGTASTPSITFIDDLNTGIYSPAANELAISTGGIGRVFIDDSGNVGIGTISPSQKLQVNGAIVAGGAAGTFSADGIYLQNKGSSIFDISAWRSGASASVLTFSTDSGSLASPQERVRIDANGNVCIGTSTPQEILTVNGNIEFATSYRISSGSGSRGNVQISSPNEGTNRSVSFGNNYYINSSGTWVQPATNIGGSALELRANNGDYGQILFRQKQDPDAGGAEQIPFFIQTNGNVGIGTTSPDTTLDVRGNIRFGTKDASNCSVEIGQGATGDRNAFIDLTGDTTYTDFGLRVVRTDGGANGSSQIVHRGTGSLEFLCLEAGSTKFSTSNSERARIDSSGRLLVGTSTTLGSIAGFGTNEQQIINNAAIGGYVNVGTSNNAFGPLFLFAKSRGGTTTIVQNGDTLGEIRFAGADGTDLNTTGAAIRAVVDGTPGVNDLPTRLVFSTTADGASGPTERMRIRSNGVININTGGTDVNVGQNSIDGITIYTANPAAGNMQLSNNGGPCFYLKRRSSDGIIIDIRRDTTSVGNISVTTSSTAYNTSSDYRLKENVVPLANAADRLNQLQVHRFNFIADPDTTVDGFLAHEAQDVVPECVTGTKDEVDDEGNPVYQGIDQSKIVPLLTAALQEALAKIEALEQRLADAGL